MPTDAQRDDGDIPEGSCPYLEDAEVAAIVGVSSFDRSDAIQLSSTDECYWYQGSGYLMYFVVKPMTPAERRSDIDALTGGISNEGSTGGLQWEEGEGSGFQVVGVDLGDRSMLMVAEGQFQLHELRQLALTASARWGGSDEIATPPETSASVIVDDDDDDDDNDEGDEYTVCGDGEATEAQVDGGPAPATYLYDGLFFCVRIPSAGTYTAVAEASFPFLGKIRYDKSNDEYWPENDSTSDEFTFQVDGPRIIEISLNDFQDIGTGSGTLTVTSG
ncbi:MAG: hypothetical protein R8F63_05625 [Acidimicrobiales bacterium]|nr:hypothetical protein [Acidimicrobiales bacterium]